METLLKNKWRVSSSDGCTHYIKACSIKIQKKFVEFYGENMDLVAVFYEPPAIIKMKDLDE